MNLETTGKRPTSQFLKSPFRSQFGGYSLTFAPRGKYACRNDQKSSRYRPTFASLPRSVTVAQQILVLFVMVRIHAG